MAKEELRPEVNEARLFAESVRALWEATRQVVYGGIDTDDLADLCSIVERLAKHRILRLQSNNTTSESASAIAQLRDYQDSASKLLSTMTMVEDWSAVEEKLASVGAAPLEPYVRRETLDEATQLFALLSESTFWDYIQPLSWSMSSPGGMSLHIDRRGSNWTWRFTGPDRNEWSSPQAFPSVQEAKSDLRRNLERRRADLVDASVGPATIS